MQLSVTTSALPSSYNGPKVTLSGEAAKDVVPEIPILAAVDRNMNNGLSSRPAAAVMPGDVWGASVEEEVVRPYLLGPHLHQQRAHSRAGLSYW